MSSTTEKKENYYPKNTPVLKQGVLPSTYFFPKRKG